PRRQRFPGRDRSNRRAPPLRSYPEATRKFLHRAAWGGECPKPPLDPPGEKAVSASYLAPPYQIVRPPIGKWLLHILLNIRMIQYSKKPFVKEAGGAHDSGSRGWRILRVCAVRRIRRTGSRRLRGTTYI